MIKFAQFSASEDWPCSILIVDDDPGLLKVMDHGLSTLGIAHTLAEDGRQAMEKLKMQHFPLVFTDMNMPDIDGMQLIVHVKDNFPETDVVAMTGYSEDYGLIDVIRAGAIDYMTKPFTLDELMAKIKRVTRERALFQFLQQEIARQRHSESNLNHEKDTLLNQVRQQKEELLAANSALRIILRQLDMEKNSLAALLVSRFQQEITPYLDKLKQTQLQEIQRHYLDVITMNLENIFLPGSQNKAYRYHPFTRTETKIVNLVKQKKSTKEVADILNVSTGTIRTHRENIRKKLQITNTKKNLYKTILSIL